MAFINIENVGSFFTEDIVFVSWPQKSFSSSSELDKKIEIILKNKTVAITVESHKTEEGLKRLLKIHETLLKEWKSQNQEITI